MTLADLTTPIEKRKVLVYVHSSNKAVIRKYDVRRICSTLYMSVPKENKNGEMEFDLMYFFPGIDIGVLDFPGILHPEREDVERLEECMKMQGMDTIENYLERIDLALEQGKFIGNVPISFLRYIDPVRADKCAEARVAFLAKREEEDRVKRAAYKAEEEAKKIAIEEEKQAERDTLLGWADGMTNMQFGKVITVMSKCYRYDGVIKTRLQFIIDCINEGRVPRKVDGVTSWYGSRWEKKESAPKTEYRMENLAENLYTVITKTEYDFATFLLKKAQVNNG